MSSGREAEQRPGVTVRPGETARPGETVRPRDPVQRLREAVRRAIAEAAARDAAPVVLIDGPSGAGKSSLADLLVTDWPGDMTPRLVRMDDLYPGWGGLDDASEAVGTDLLAPLRASGVGWWRKWDWAADRPAERHTVTGTAPVIVEGCGTLARANTALADLALWLDADDTLRKERALARDGLSFATHWDQWQHDFERYVEREQPRENASLVLDVTGWPLAAARLNAPGGAVGANVVS